MPSYGNHRFHVLDGMRGIAAILVILYHFFMHEPSSHSLVNPYIAVDFFFILSGFVIMHAYGERLLEGMPVLAYIKQRVIRLYPLMAMGILIGAPAFYLFTTLGHTDYSKRDIAASVLANLSFLPFFNDKSVFYADAATVGRVFPVDGALWSIFFEMAASLAFVLIVQMSKKRMLKLCLLSFGVVVVSSISATLLNYNATLESGMGWGTLNFMGGFPRVLYGFSCGVLLYKWRSRHHEKKRMRPLLADLQTLVLYNILAACLLFPYRVFGLYYFASILFIAPALVWFGSHAQGNSVPVVKASQFLSWLSYPIYCLHLPVLMGCAVLDEKTQVVSRLGFSYQIAAIAVTLALAVMLTKLVDEPVRKWLAKQFLSTTSSVETGKA